MILYCIVELSFMASVLLMTKPLLNALHMLRERQKTIWRVMGSLKLGT